MSTSSEAPNVHDLGITVLSEPLEGEEVVADIVFVHGLQGNPKRTWTWTKTASSKGTKRRSKLVFWRKRLTERFDDLEIRNDSDGDEAGTSESRETFWPYHLLRKDIKNVRILTWGYDSVVSRFFSGTANKGNIYSHSRSLLADLISSRLDCPDRRIIFVAHSLGGIIVKAMLLRASESNREPEKELFKSTHAILFLGTPHRGGNFIGLGETMRRIVSASGFDTAHQNLKTLTIDSAVLEDLQERFLKLYFRGHIEIRTFQEAMGLKAFSPGGLNNKVVDDVSSAFTGEEPRLPIDANHMDMCRYKNREDNGYRKVSSELLALCRHAEMMVKKKERSIAAKPEYIIEPGWLDSLEFPEMNARHREVLDARENSCQWILNHQKYQQWAEHEHGLLWIQGKPGSGKSTLMKRIHRNLERKDKGSTHVHLTFFFHKRGARLQHTFTGMLQVLLHQLLTQVPGAGCYFGDLYKQRVKFQGGQKSNWHWQESDLRSVVKDTLVLVSMTHSISLFLDALDEAGDGPACSVVSYLHDINEEFLASGHRTSICFSCRHYPLIRTNEGIQICVEDENRSDIDTYIEAEVRRTIKPFGGPSGQSDLDQLQRTISNKASGIFLWVVLIIPIIAKLHRGGKPMSKIIDGLIKAPATLQAIYMELLTIQEVEDTESPIILMEKRLHLMQWICLAETPLTLTELRFALASDDIYISKSQQSASDSVGFVENDSRMAAIVVDLSAGLAEVQLYHDRDRDDGKEDEIYIVQFIHQSVDDFLLTEGLRLLNQDSTEDAVGLGNARLSNSCINYLKFSEVGSAHASEKLFPSTRTTHYHTFTRQDPRDRTMLNGTLPFLGYAVGALFLHAQTAEHCGVKQASIITRFQWPTSTIFDLWKHFFLKLWATPERVSPTRGVTFLHIAANSNLNSVVRVLLQEGETPDPPDENGNTPLHYAAAKGHVDVAATLISGSAHIDARKQWSETCLDVAVEAGKFDIAELFLQQGIEVDLVTPLHRAASTGMVGLMRLLLDSGADYAAESSLYDHALAAAMQDRGQSALNFLLKRGADVNSHLTNYGSLLQLAIRQAKLAHGGMYGNTLQAAMSEDNIRDGMAVHIVKLLLDRGVDVNAGTERRGNALDFAEERLEKLEAQAAKSSADFSEEINDTDAVVKLLRRRGALRSRDLKNISSV